MTKPALRVLGRIAVRASLAGLALGIVETARLLRVEATPGVALVALGVTLLGVAALATLAHLVGSAIARLPPVQAWGTRIAVAGESRLRAIIAVLLVGLVTARTWIAIASAAAWALGRFKGASAAGILVATVGVAALAGLVALATALHGPLARSLATRPTLQRLTTGRQAAAIAGGGVVLLLIGGALGLTRAVPGFDFAPAFMATGGVLALATIALLRGGRVRPTSSISVAPTSMVVTGVAMRCGAAPGTAITSGTCSSSAYSDLPWKRAPCSSNCSPWSAVTATMVSPARPGMAAMPSSSRPSSSSA